MQVHDEDTQQIIQNKIIKVNGEIGYKRYSKGKMIGKGGFAKCYQGLNIQTKIMYAMKVLDKSTLQKNRTKQKLMSEIKIHKTLHHKHIVEFDSVFQDAKSVYIILQLCTNKTLSQMVKKRKKLTPKQTRYFIIQIVTALEYMHNNRVIHRDLKMGNVFLNQDMNVKIGDFGLATKLQFNDQKKRTMCGTPNYIAPEIVQGAIGHSYQVDIWSTGVLCYALLCGRPPFQTDQVKLTYKKIKNCDYTVPNTIPDDAKDFIKKILVLNPKQRLTIKQMYAHPFLNNQDVPKFIPIQALISVPNFKITTRQDKSPITRFKSQGKLRAQDFNKRKPQLHFNINTNGNNINGNKPQLDGIQSPRNIFNTQLSDKLTQKPQQPQSSLTKQQQQQHKIHILAYVDYSKKYGLGYLINNKQYGIYFNDQTLMSTDLQSKKVFYIDNPSKQDNIISYTQQNLPVSKDFQKKYMLLQKFIPYLNDQVSNLPQSKQIYHKNQIFIYMKQWLITKHAIMFGLSNKIFQVNFFDHSQILLNTQKKTVLFHNKKKQKTYQTLSNALQTADSQMSRRIKYTKDILNSIKQKRQQKTQKTQQIVLQQQQKV